MSSSEQSTDKAVDETQQISAKEGAHTDTVVEPKTPKNKPAKLETKKTVTKKSKSLVFLMLVLIALLTTAGGFAYQYWLQLEATLNSLQADKDSQASKLSAIAEQLKESQSVLAQQQQAFSQLGQDVSRYQQQINDLSATQNTLLQTSKNIFDISHRDQTQWLLAEVSYLLSLGNQRLIVSKDITSATAALRAANNRLHDLADPSLLNLRKKIAFEIAQLNTIKLPDISGIAFDLDNATLLIHQLSFKTTQQRTEDDNTAAEKIELSSLDKDALLAPLWDRIKSLVTIKKHKRDFQKTETTVSKNDIDSQLRYRLETARVALINKNTAVFNHEIKMALDTLTLFYDKKDNRVDTLIKNLSPLSRINLTPELPDITGSWLILQNVIAVVEANTSLTPDQKGKGKL